MRFSILKYDQTFKKQSCPMGFTLVELLIAMVVAIIAIGAVYTVYTVQQRSYGNQQLALEAQQNLRGAMIILEQEIRLAGYDPEDSNQFGIVDVRRYDEIRSRRISPSGQPALFYTIDEDENGALDDRNANRNREHPNFRMRNDLNTGRVYLAWDRGAGRLPLAENIQAIGFAYAIDDNRNGRLDTWQGGTNIIWAVDADNDNLLDTHIDANNDGVIDERDDTNNDNMITRADGAVLNPQVALNRIKAVRVWLLAVSMHPLQGHYNNRSYVVGDRIIPASNDGFMRRVLETIIECRNL